jgi:flagellar basal-body rod modification protein FlgD
MPLTTNEDFFSPFTTNESRMLNSIRQLAYSLQSNQALQASTFVGRKVMVCSNLIRLKRAGASPVYIDIYAGITQLTATIHSETNEQIRKILFLEPSAPVFEFIWDGLNQKDELMPLGKYTIDVKGVYKGNEIILKTQIAANIDSVSLNPKGEGVTLSVEGVGEVALNLIETITP